MDKQPRNIYVAGNYIASQTIGTQILHADRVNTNNPDKEQPHEVEDVAFEEVGTNASVSRAAHHPFVVPEKLKELNLYTMSEFETMYRDAAKSDAPIFAKFLKQYQKLGVLDFGLLNKKEIFNKLAAFFSNEIQYNYRNFATYF